MEQLSVIQVRDFAIVAVAIMGLIVLVGNAVKTIKEWRKPGMSEAEWRREVNTKLDTDNKRIKNLEDGNKVICRALIAMLSHEINGNSKDKLQNAMADLQEYLIER